MKLTKKETEWKTKIEIWKKNKTFETFKNETKKQNISFFHKSEIILQKIAKKNWNFAFSWWLHEFHFQKSVPTFHKIFTSPHPNKWLEWNFFLQNWPKKRRNLDINAGGKAFKGGGGGGPVDKKK